MFSRFFYVLFPLILIMDYRIFYEYLNPWVWCPHAVEVPLILDPLLPAHPLEGSEPLRRPLVEDLLGSFEPLIVAGVGRVGIETCHGERGVLGDGSKNLIMGFARSLS